MSSNRVEEIKKEDKKAFKGFLIIIIGESILVTVVKRQTLTGSHPYPVGIINGNATGYITGNAVRIHILMAINWKIVAIVLIYTIICCKP